jgi:hypothetical protein
MDQRICNPHARMHIDGYHWCPPALSPPIGRRPRGPAGRSPPSEAWKIEIGFDSDRAGQSKRALPRLAGGFEPQLVLAFHGRVRLGGQQPGVDADGVLPTAGRPAELSDESGMHGTMPLS